jgi:hypothetical protein
MSSFGINLCCYCITRAASIRYDIDSNYLGKYIKLSAGQACRTSHAQPELSIGEKRNALKVEHQLPWD